VLTARPRELYNAAMGRILRYIALQFPDEPIAVVNEGLSLLDVLAVPFLGRHGGVDLYVGERNTPC